MSEEFDENVVSLVQRVLPLLSSVLFLLLGYIPLNVAMFNNVRPDLGLACVYFWLLHRPDLFGLCSIVVLGLLVCTLSSGLPGAALLSYLVMYLMVYNTQKFFNSKPFAVVWYGFMALALVTLLVKWLVVSMYYSRFLPLSMLMFSYLIGVALYPLMSLVLAFVQNRLVQDENE
jgi:rod shape-determining protein MreD